jgi:hypothetical protein
MKIIQAVKKFAALGMYRIAVAGAAFIAFG